MRKRSSIHHRKTAVTGSLISFQQSMFFSGDLLFFLIPAHIGVCRARWPAWNARGSPSKPCLWSYQHDLTDCFFFLSLFIVFTESTFSTKGLLVLIDRLLALQVISTKLSLSCWGGRSIRQNIRLSSQRTFAYKMYADYTDFAAALFNNQELVAASDVLCNPGGSVHGIFVCCVFVCAHM